MSRLFALAASFSLVVAPAMVAGPNPPTLVEAEGGFSYTPPKGWRIFTIPGLKYKVAAGSPTKGFAPNINVVDEAFSGTIEEYGKANLAGLGPAVTQFKSLGQKSFTTASGLKGVKLATRGMQQDRLLSSSTSSCRGKMTGSTWLPFPVWRRQGPSTTLM